MSHMRSIAPAIAAAWIAALKTATARPLSPSGGVTASRGQRNAADRLPRKLTGGGADNAFECVGLGEIVAQANGCPDRQKRS